MIPVEGALYGACKRGDIKALSALSFDIRQVVPHTDNDNSPNVSSSPLHVAIHYNQVDCAVWLVRERGSNLCRADVCMIHCVMNDVRTPEMIIALHKAGVHLEYCMIFVGYWSGYAFITNAQYDATVSVHRARALLDCGVTWNTNRRGPQPLIVTNMILVRTNARQRAMAMLGVARRLPRVRNVLGLIAQQVWALRWCK